MLCRRAIALPWLPALLLTVLTAATVQAQTDPPTTPPDPDAVADRCIERITGIVTRCDDRLTHIADRAVEAIEAAEDDAVIARLARRSIGSVNKTAASCVRAVRNNCRRCLAALDRLGADQALMDNVEAACERAIQEIRDSRAAAVKKIKDTAGTDGGANSA